MFSGKCVCVCVCARVLGHGTSVISLCKWLGCVFISEAVMQRSSFVLHVSQDFIVTSCAKCTRKQREYNIMIIWPRFEEVHWNRKTCWISSISSTARKPCLWMYFCLYVFFELMWKTITLITKPTSIFPELFVFTLESGTVGTGGLIYPFTLCLPSVVTITRLWFHFFLNFYHVLWNMCNPTTLFFSFGCRHDCIDTLAELYIIPNDLVWFSVA